MKERKKEGKEGREERREPQEKVRDVEEWVKGRGESEGEEGGGEG